MPSKDSILLIDTKNGIPAMNKMSIHEVTSLARLSSCLSAMTVSVTTLFGVQRVVFPLIFPSKGPQIFSAFLISFVVIGIPDIEP
jgi:hypothetical protein